VFKLFAAIAVFAGACLLTACSSSSGDTTPTPTHLGGGSTTNATSATPTSAASTAPATAESTGGSTEPATANPCDLVTQAEVSQATGVPVEAGILLNDGKQCQWNYTDPSDQFTGLNISFSLDSDPEAFAEDQQGGLGTVVVSGVGDEAYFDPAGIASILTFRKGDLLFDVGMNVAGSLKDQFTSDVQQSAERQVALAALARIP
jgi:hypothetical protein